MSDGREQCLICHKLTFTINWHHTIPRSLGGEDSIQIPLCGDCHDTLHHKADAYFAQIKGSGKKAKARYWINPADEQRAEPWFRVLLAAMLNPPIQQEDKLILVPGFKSTRQLRVAMDILKQDLKSHGITNLSKLVEYCVRFTLDNKGIPHEKSCRQKHKSKSKRIKTSRHHKKLPNKKNRNRSTKLW